MAENSAIEWTHHTFNPWWGCQKVSPACDHCYAERDAKRFAPGQVLWGVGAERRTFGDKHWEAPGKWNEKALAMRQQLGTLHERPRVFCASMADWLDLDGPMAEFVRLLDTIRVTPELDWLLLSKRIGNFEKRLRAARDEVDFERQRDLWLWITEWYREGNPPANVWIGSTVVTQEEADRDIPKLLQVPARVRFLSIEPMLGPINLLKLDADGSTPLSKLSWVICGGESGPGARPMHPDWARSLRDQCKAAGVPFLFKQWGEWHPSPASGAHYPMGVAPDGSSIGPDDQFTEDCALMYRVGKKAAGRQLDGVQHDGYPA